MLFTREQLETPLAELEEYGLDVRIVSILEMRYDAVYIKDLIKIDSTQLEATAGLGPVRLNQLREAIKNCFESMYEVQT